MLANVDRPCSTAATMVREVVVEQHEVGGLAGDVGARPAHGDADRGRLAERGASLTPSPVMATTCPRACRASAIRSLSSGRHPATTMPSWSRSAPSRPRRQAGHAR